MFDIGFPELMIVSVVALLVLGPERLPVALRTLGLWFGRMRRSFSAVKVEIEREIGMDEVRRQLHNEAILDEMRALESDVNHIGKNVADDTANAIETTADDLENAMSDLEAKSDLSAPSRPDDTDIHFEEGEAELEEPRDFDTDDFQYSNEPHPNDNRGN